MVYSVDHAQSLLEQARTCMSAHGGMSEAAVLTETLRYPCDLPAEALAHPREAPGLPRCGRGGTLSAEHAWTSGTFPQPFSRAGPAVALRGHMGHVSGSSPLTGDR